MRKLLSFFIVMAVAWGAWRMGHRTASVADGGRGEALFYGRAWIDHLPRSENDRFQVFGTSKASPVGWFAERTAWKGEWEGFRYQPRGDGQIDIVRPATGEKARFSYRAWTCRAEGFHFCLELKGPRGAQLYYSRRGWEKRTLDEPGVLDELLE